MAVHEHHRDPLTFGECSERGGELRLDVRETVFADGREVESPVCTSLSPDRGLRNSIEVAGGIRHVAELVGVLPREGDRVVPCLDPELPAVSRHQDLAEPFSREGRLRHRPAVNVT